MKTPTHLHFDNEQQRRADNKDERLATEIAFAFVAILIICLIVENISL